MTLQLLDELRSRASQSGLNLFGLVDTERFDSCQSPDWRARRLLPACGTIAVFGSGGRTFWQKLCASDGKPAAPAADYHPVQNFAVRRMHELGGWLATNGIRSRLVGPEDDDTLNFLQLGEAAGLGTVSPVIHLLLHPEFGPWISLRAALLLEGRPFGDVADAALTDWHPCCLCSKPCISACPVGVHDVRGNSDYERCANHRHAGNCTTGCSVRRACPVGAEHRYDAGEEAHRHAYSLFAMQRWFGLGRWRFVPRFLRR
jgi:epoxyqueuosine reductase